MKATNSQDLQIELTNAAFEQILLIQSNDYTLSDHIFRLKIGGKGCDGFTYDTGFSVPDKDDHTFTFSTGEHEIKLNLDPFTYFYCKEGILDYVLDPAQNQDGFTFTNKNESIYQGKFFQAEELVPAKDDL